MKINQLKAGVILTYASQALHIASGLIYTPIMLRLLGQSEFGLYQLVSSVVSYLSLINLGFHAGYIRVYSRYKVQNNADGIAKLNGMYTIVFALMGIVCLLCGTVMTQNAHLIFGSGLSTGELQKAKVLMAILVVNIAVTLMGSVTRCYLTACESFVFQKLLDFLKSLLNPFITLPLLIMGFGSVAIVITSLALTVSVFVMDIWFCLRKLSMKFDFKGFDFGLFKEILVFTSFIFLNTVVDQLNWCVDKVLLGRFLGTTAVAVYGVAGGINSMYLGFSSAVSGVFVPRVNTLVAQKKDDKQITYLFTKVGRIQALILFLIISGYILFGKEFIRFWAGEGYSEAYYIGILLMLPLTVPLLQNLGIEIQRAQKRHKIRAYVLLGVAIANVIASIPLIKLYGTIGAAAGTAITMIIGNIGFINIYYHKRLGLDMIYFWKEILKLIPALMLSVMAGSVMRMIIPAKSIVFLAVNIGIYCIVYLLFMWIIGMNKSEKELLKDPLKKFFKVKW